MVIIQHTNGYFTLYQHLKAGSITVQTGNRITNLSDKIGEVGNTGIGTGNHLHFEICRNLTVRSNGTVSNFSSSASNTVDPETNFKHILDRTYFGK